MKSRTLLFASIVGLAAVTLSAQSQYPSQSQTPSQTQTPTQTQTQDQGQPLTLSGTVVSSTSTQLVLDTDTGRQTYIVDTRSNLPANLATGSRVSIQYHDLGGGRLHLASASLLDRPTMGTEVPMTGMAGTNTQTPMGRGTTTSPDTEETPSTRMGTTTTTTPDTMGIPERAPRARGEMGTSSRLPKTASSLPLMGLAGALALAGGLALRYR